MEIDLVYLWVNGNDPVWQAKRRAITGDVEQNSSADCKGRYVDNGELKYSLRSIELYAPWIRKIFIVTDAQVPEWLDTSNPKIQIVDHTEILPPESLPCFNSTVIEHFLFRIPGLSEHFLLANDDTLLNRPTTPETFFGPDGLPVFRMNRKRFRKAWLWFREKILKKELNNHLRIIANAADLVEREYGVYYGSRTHHNIDAYLRSDYEQIYEVFKDDIKPTLPNHTRKENDIHRHIYTYASMAKKRAHIEYVDRYTSFSLQIHEADKYEEMDRCNPIFFCMNDSQFAQDSDRERAMDYLKKRFPEKSKFEK